MVDSVAIEPAAEEDTGQGVVVTGEKVRINYFRWEEETERNKHKKLRDEAHLTGIYKNNKKLNKK